MFRVMSQRALVGGRSTGDRLWGVSAQIDRPGFDRKDFRGLEVVPHPPELPAMALVLPHEIGVMQRDRDRGINTSQRSARSAFRPKMTNPADGVALRCDQPAARRAQALMVDVNLPRELGLEFSIGLFLYESSWERSGESGSIERFREIWASAQPIGQVGVSRMVLRVPPDQAPTHHGERVSTWWDVRPCFGQGTDDPSQCVSQPVIIRP